MDVDIGRCHEEDFENIVIIKIVPPLIRVHSWDFYTTPWGTTSTMTIDEALVSQLSSKMTLGRLISCLPCAGGVSAVEKPALLDGSDLILSSASYRGGVRRGSTKDFEEVRGPSIHVVAASKSASSVGLTQSRFIFWPTEGYEPKDKPPCCCKAIHAMPFNLELLPQPPFTFEGEPTLIIHLSKHRYHYGRLLSDESATHDEEPKSLPLCCWDQWRQWRHGSPTASSTSAPTQRTPFEHEKLSEGCCR